MQGFLCRDSFIISASGLLCYGESGTSEQCAGVCATLTALEDGTINNGVQIRKGRKCVLCKHAYYMQTVY